MRKKVNAFSMSPVSVENFEQFTIVNKIVYYYSFYVFLAYHFWPFVYGYV